LEQIIQNIDAKDGETNPLDLNNWLSELSTFHWVYETNIMSVLEVDFLKLEDVLSWRKNSFSMFIKDEFSTDT